jgi:hypothetical protein
MSKRTSSSRHAGKIWCRYGAFAPYFFWIWRRYGAFAPYFLGTGGLFMFYTKRGALLLPSTGQRWFAHDRYTSIYLWVVMPKCGNRFPFMSANIAIPFRPALSSNMLFWLEPIRITRRPEERSSYRRSGGTPDSSVAFCPSGPADDESDSSCGYSEFALVSAFEFPAFSYSFREQSRREPFTGVIERGSLLSSGYAPRNRRKHGSQLHSYHGEVTLPPVPGQVSRAWYPIAMPPLAPVNALLPASDQSRSCS